TARVRDTGNAGNAELLELYLRNLDKGAKFEHVQKWIEVSPAPLEFGQTLLRYRFGTEVDLRIYDAVNVYLEKRSLIAAGQEQTLVRNDFWRWNKQYAEALLDLRDYAQATTILSRVQEKFGSTDDSDTTFEIALMRAKALALSGKQEDAFASLQEYLKSNDQNPREDRYRGAIESLKGTALENPLKEDMYAQLLAAGRTEDAIYAGLAELKLQKGNLDEANALLRKMIYLQSENLDAFHSAAELLEKYNRWNEAIQLRQELAKRKPWDQANLTVLAKDQMELGQKQEAAKVAAKIVTAPSATSADRSTAAEVYGKTATNSIGPSELIAIQNSVRGVGARLRTALSPYAHHLRSVLLKQNDAPSSNLVRAEVFLTPDDPSLLLSLFRALVREGKCLQALETLDPDEARHGTYVSRERFFGHSEEYAYDDYSNHPVERLNLEEEETRRIATQMADCAKKEGDLAGELFFRQMARAHTFIVADQNLLSSQIAALQKQIAEETEVETRNHTIAINIGRTP
ncbi:MAG: tetratricopeptide repeat protein, partial [Acidobacteriota bacterium]